MAAFHFLWRAGLRPAVFRRAVVGLLGPEAVRSGEDSQTLRPSHHTTLTRSAVRARLGEQLTLVSFNVKRAEHMDEVAATLTRIMHDHNPDLLLLQEAPRELLHRPEIDASLAGRDILFAAFHRVTRLDKRYPFAAFGQVVASSVSLDRTEAVALPTVNPASLGRGHSMQRIVLLADLACSDGRRATLANVHLEPFARPRARRAQYTTMLRAIEDRRTNVALLAGDFNPTWLQRTEPGQRDLETAGFSNLFATRWRALDTCFSRGHRRILDTERLEQRGSDHRPILVRMNP